MDLTSIEATSVAIRAGQVAAAELANLLLREDVEPGAPIEDWFDPRPPAATVADVLIDLGNTLAIVDKLGGYVCHSADAVSGERLYRWAVIEGLCSRVEWADRPFGQRQAFELFATVVRHVHTALKAEQARLETKPAPTQTRLALEDSIFEPTTSLGELRKESVAAGPLIANYDKAQLEEIAGLARELQNLRGLVVGIEKMTADQLRAAIAEAREGNGLSRAAEEPLSIAEPPARHRSNRGGRGNRKN